MPARSTSWCRALCSAPMRCLRHGIPYPVPQHAMLWAEPLLSLYHVSYDVLKAFKLMIWLRSEACGAQQGLDDPFKGRTAAARVARDGYLHMWDVLVREAAASELLFDSYLLEKLTNLVIALNWCAHAHAVHGVGGAYMASSTSRRP